MEPVEALANYLAVDLAFGALGTSVFMDYLPDSPDGSLDTATAVISLPGQPGELALRDDTDRPSFQFVARDLDATAARARIRAIYDALQGLAETDIHGVHFKLLNFVQSGPVPLGRDERQRFIFTINTRSMVAGVSR